MTTKNNFYLLMVIYLLLIISYISADEEYDGNYDFGEKLILLISHDINGDINSQSQYDDEAQKNIALLKERGYSQITRPPSLFSTEIYHMVYDDLSKDERYKDTAIFKDGINYILTYASHKPEDPNFYVTVTFESRNKRYWFLKINYFLEYSRIDEWLNMEINAVTAEKIFY